MVHQPSYLNKHVYYCSKSILPIFISTISVGPDVKMTVSRCFGPHRYRKISYMYVCIIHIAPPYLIFPLVSPSRPLVSPSRLTLSSHHIFIPSHPFVLFTSHPPLTLSHTIVILSHHLVLSSTCLVLLSPCLTFLSSCLTSSIIIIDGGQTAL